MDAHGLKHTTVEECKIAMDEAQQWAASVGYQEENVNDIIKEIRQRKDAIEPFDYTKWRENHLDSSVNVREISKKAMDYQRNNL